MNYHELKLVWQLPTLDCAEPDVPDTTPKPTLTAQYRGSCCSPLINQFDLAGPPGLVEPGLQWAVEA